LRASQALVASTDGDRHSRPTDAADQQHHAPMAAMRLALLQLVETRPEHAGDQLELGVEPTVLARPAVGGDRLAELGRQLAVGTELVDQRARKTLPVRGLGLRRGAGLAADDQAENAMLATEALVRQHFLVDPARLRGRWRADDDLESGLLERLRAACRRGWSRP
jgi:hypothetical protein